MIVLHAGLISFCHFARGPVNLNGPIPVLSSVFVGWAAADGFIGILSCSFF